MVCSPTKCLAASNLATLSTHACAFASTEAGKNYRNPFPGNPDGYLLRFCQDLGERAQP